MKTFVAVSIVVVMGVAVSLYMQLLLSTVFGPLSLTGCSMDEAAFIAPPFGLNGSLVTTASPDNERYQLAKRQSLGFFDDIPDHQWKRAQYIHSKLFPNYYNDLFRYSSGPSDRGKVEKLNPSKNWNGRNFQEEFHCPLQQRLPTDSQADGPKWVCDPHRLRDVSDCLIYSFGSNGKAEFEKGVHDETGGNCEIHTFDPVSRNRRNGNFTEALAGYSTFHNWGLGTPQEEARGGNYKTLRTIMRELGHTNRTVHVFKIDCEWCEWFTYQQWLEFDLRQILVETHNAPMPNARDFFFDLHDAGYVIFSKEANYENGAGCVEFAFLKLSAEFFQGKLYNSSSAESKS